MGNININMKTFITCLVLATVAMAKSVKRR